MHFRAKLQFQAPEALLEAHKKQGKGPHLELNINMTQFCTGMAIKH